MEGNVRLVTAVPGESPAKDPAQRRTLSVLFTDRGETDFFKGTPLL